MPDSIVFAVVVTDDARVWAGTFSAMMGVIIFSGVTDEFRVAAEVSPLFFLPSLLEAGALGLESFASGLKLLASVPAFFGAGHMAWVIKYSNGSPDFSCWPGNAFVPPQSIGSVPAVGKIFGRAGVTALRLWCLLETARGPGAIVPSIAPRAWPVARPSCSTCRGSGSPRRSSS